MREQVPEVVVLALLELGREVARAEGLALLRAHEWADRLHWSAWGVVVERLGSEEHFALLKGIVAAEKTLGWHGGSVAASIWVARSMVERHREQWAEVSAWIAANGGHNPWLRSPHQPYTHLGPAEWGQHVSAERARHAAHRERAAQDQDQARVRRQERQAEARRRDAERLARQTSGTATRAERLARLATLPVAQRLAHAASDLAVGLDYYPATWADDDADALDALGSDALRLLARRSSQRTGRAWRSVGARARALLAARGGCGARGKTPMWVESADG